MSDIVIKLKRIWNRHAFVRHFAVLGLFLCVSILCYHWFYGQFYSDMSHFFYLGYDSIAQVMSGASFLEYSWSQGQPFWSWSYGVGGDIFTEFSYYYTTSPFFILTFLVKSILGVQGAGMLETQQWMIYTTVFRQTLAMFFMYLLMKQEGKKTHVGILSGVIFGCSKWFFVNAISFNFANDAYVWLPLMGLAYNHYEKKKKWLPLAVVIALTVANNFYYGFMSCVLYGSFFLIMSFRKGNSIKEYGKSVGKLIGISFLGILLSAVFFIPSVYGLLSADRVPTGMNTDVIPSASLINTLPEQFMSLTGAFFFPPFLLLFLSLPFKKLSERQQKKTVLALIWMVLVCIPLFSSVMNGFSYPTSRWYYLVVFAVSYAIPDWIEALEQHKASKKQVVFAAVCFVLLFITRKERGLDSEGYIMFCTLILGTAGILLLGWKSWFKREWLIKGTSVALVFCVICSGILQARYIYRRQCSNSFALQTMDNVVVGSGTQKWINDLVKSTPKDFYRIEDLSVNDSKSRYENRSWLNRNSTVSAYNSSINGDLHRWFKRTSNITSAFDCPSYYRGFNNRLFLDIAWNVRYKINVGEREMDGYRRITLENGQPALESEYQTGFDLWYDSVLASETYDSMDYAQRDAAILQAVTLEGATGSYPQATIDQVTEYTSMSLSEAVIEGADYQDGLLSVEEEAVLTFAVPERVDNYGEYLLSFKLDELTNSRYSINVNGQDTSCFEETYAYSYNSEEFSYKLSGDTQSITIKLGQGKYEITDMRLAYNSYDQLQNWVDARNVYNLEQLSVDASRISGTLNNTTDGVLVLSMPYNKGWHCTVNGESVPLIKANEIFVGIELSAGENNISMYYFPPYLLFGLGVTLFTIAGIVAFNMYNKKKKQ